MLPTTQEYKISLMIGQDSFRTLEGVKVIPNPNYPDEPWYSTGGLAIVFKLKLKDKLYALKCFYTEANERQERLGLIAAYLKQNPSTYFVDFTYLEDELWVESDNDEGQGYPVVLMEWVEGKTLDNYLEQICSQNNIPALKNLYFQFCNLAWWLQQQPVAHGDIKHDNLIVTPDGKLKLIDYDGVFVPALRGRKANEKGSPCYQHPKRDAYFFDKNLDDYSLLVLQITLLALQQQPKLFTEHYNGDGIILKDIDYRNFAQSPIKTILWQLPEVKIPLLLSQLQGNLNNLSAIDLMPLLQDVAWINWLVGGQQNDKLEFERQSLKELVKKSSKFRIQELVNKFGERQRLKELVLKDKNWRELFTYKVSHNYPLNEKLIEKYEDKWCWDWLRVNEALTWSIQLIEKFEDRLNWGFRNDNFYKKIFIIEGISLLKNLPWSFELIEKYEKKWNWEHLSKNTSLPWSPELIEKYQDKWDWRRLSWNESKIWSLELIEKFENKWNWERLSYNKSLPWSINLIEKYRNKWDWRTLSINECLPWSLELIEKYENRWDWQTLSMNEYLMWSIELFEKYENRWDWGRLSQSIPLPWSLELIEKYKNKWDWGKLSRNKFLPWSLKLIEKYEDKWDWKGLSNNEFLPWSLELTEKYKDKWDCEGLSCNKMLPWSDEFIDKNKLDRGKLMENISLPWSIELIEKFKPLWATYFFNEKFKLNTAIYAKVFQPLLNDEFIDEIMAEM